MKKLLKFVDDNLLKAIVAFLLVFIPVYPKLPAIDIPHTWVYIRLEDFLIAAAVALFAIQFLRRKVTLFRPLAIPIFAYWAVGFVSLVITILIIGPTVAHFFPTLAILSYLRRIEYMLLFFVGFAAVNNKKDFVLFIGALILGNLIITLYGVGQRYYLDLWQQFPKFFEMHAFCFPSIQTTNEEFAKGIPMCLPKEGRITSLFGGHYDLSAYLVLVIPAILAFAISVKKLWKKIPLFILSAMMVFVLILTSSRVSFAAYIIGAVAALIFIGRKKYIIPVLIITVLLSSMTPDGVLDRFMKTFRLTNVVLDESGQVVGTTDDGLSEELKRKLAQNKKAIGKQDFEALPAGSSIIGFGQSTATNQAILKKSLSELEQEKYAYGAIQISSVSGTFLVQKALVYDISFTTRFQSEWPNAWRAFLRNPLTGSGYSTITLATDNSLLRALGEVGALGFAAFVSFFVAWYFFMKKQAKYAPVPVKFFAFGLSGGIIGLFINAIMIDVFEASKVAENLWLILGVTAGSVALTTEYKGGYLRDLKKMLLSVPFLCLYLIIVAFTVIGFSMDNFFVADDFTWMKWAATASPQTLAGSFVDAQGFFLRPISKIVFFVLYTLNAFKPFGYYFVNTALHVSIALLMFGFLHIIFKKKWISFLGALFFTLLPVHHQNLFWLSTNSITLSTFFILAGLLMYYFARVKSVFFYIPAFVCFLLAPFTYEGGIVFLPLVFLFDLFIVPKEGAQIKKLSFWTPYIVGGLITLLYIGVRMQANAAGFSGDYDYNYAKIIPNSVGNFAGYIGTFLIGTPVLPFFSNLRDNSRELVVPISLGILFVGAIIAGFLIIFKPFKKAKLSDYKIGSFGLGFGIVSLLPFLGLGNLSERYLFLGSIGFTVLFIFVLQKIFSPKHYKYLYGILIAVIILNTAQVIVLERQWHEASRIVYRNLVDLKADYADLTSQSILYVNNVPVTYKNAYVYPYGYEDSLWFVYRTRLPQIKRIKTEDIPTAKKERETYQVHDAVNKYHLFIFDENGKLVEHK